MKCPKCRKKMQYEKELSFNEHKIDGFKCSCGEIFFNPEKAQKILLLNKLKKEKIKAKLGKIKSNLILRLPKSIEEALNFKKGDDVFLEIDKNTLKISK